MLVGFNRLLGRKSHVADPAFEPTITVILPVHNEARRIAEKVRNLLELDYPHGKLQLLVIGDACTDGSLERARAAGGDLVVTIPLATRAGKAAGLNAGLERATGEIVVFTDAGIMLERNRCDDSWRTSRIPRSPAFPARTTSKAAVTAKGSTAGSS